MQGLCRGCGAKFSQAGADNSGKTNSATPGADPFQRLQHELTDVRLELPEPKSVWKALSWTLSFGPFGMVYSTIRGAVIMTIVSGAAAYFLGERTLFITLPICLVWAGYAAWRSGYIS